MIRRNRRTGRWFELRLRALLGDDTVLAAQFRTSPDESTEEGS